MRLPLVRNNCAPIASNEESTISDYTNHCIQVVVHIPFLHHGYTVIRRGSVATIFLYIPTGNHWWSSVIKNRGVRKSTTGLLPRVPPRLLCLVYPGCPRFQGFHMLGIYAWSLQDALWALEMLVTSSGESSPWQHDKTLFINMIKHVITHVNGMVAWDPVHIP